MSELGLDPWPKVLWSSHFSTFPAWGTLFLSLLQDASGTTEKQGVLAKVLKEVLVEEGESENKSPLGDCLWAALTTMLLPVTPWFPGFSLCLGASPSPAPPLFCHTALFPGTSPVCPPVQIGTSSAYQLFTVSSGGCTPLPVMQALQNALAPPAS